MFYGRDTNKQEVPFIVILICAVLVPVLVYYVYDLSYIKEVLPPMKIIGLNQTIKIEDNVGLFDEDSTSKIMSSFENFRDKTGITPRMYVVYNDEWQNDYDNFSDYAVNLYNKSVLDSEHWFLVYSVNRDDPEGDWHWQTVNGYDIYPLVTKYVQHRFTEVFEEGLLDENTSISDAVCKAVDNMTEEAFGRGVGPDKRKVIPVKLDYEDHEIFIQDNSGKLSEEDIAKIRKAFEDFQKATGFTPALYVTVYDEWSYDYDSPADFTRDVYNSHWKDGKHWLMTYTIDPGDPSRWYWKTWIGGTAASLIDNAVHNVAGETMNANYQDENDSFADALVKTMEAMTADACKTEQSTDASMFKIAATYAGFVIFEAVIWGVYFFRRHKAAKQNEEE